MKEWTREIPESPKKKPSIYWWYWDDRDEEPTVMEIWPNRSLSHKKGWWAVVQVNKPLTDPRKTPPTPPPEFNSKKGNGLLDKKTS